MAKTSKEKRLIAAVDIDGRTLATFVTVDEALAFFERTDAAVHVIRTRRALSVGRIVWQWVETIAAEVRS